MCHSVAVRSGNESDASEHPANPSDGSHRSTHSPSYGPGVCHPIVNTDHSSGSWPSVSGISAVDVDAVADGNRTNGGTVAPLQRIAHDVG